MGGITPLRGITRECCALRFWFRERQIRRGQLPDSDHFTCTIAGGCGQAWIRRDGVNWDPISPLEDVKDWLAHRPKDLEPKR